MSKVKKSLALLSLLALSACRQSYLSVQQEWIDGRYLASTHVNTPDPRQANPPYGQRLLIHWWVPSDILDHSPNLVLEVIFKNFTQKKVVFPLRHRTGQKIFSLLNDEYHEKHGLLAWRAQIVTEDGSVFKEWKHQLWVKLIELNDKPIFTPEPETPIYPKNFGHEDTDEEYYGRRTDPESEELISSSFEAESMSSSVEDQSKQGSVIESPDFSESSPSESD